MSEFCPICGRVMLEDMDGFDDVAAGKSYFDGEVMCVKCANRRRRKEQEKIEYLRNHPKEFYEEFGYLPEPNYKEKEEVEKGNGT